MHPACLSAGIFFGAPNPPIFRGCAIWRLQGGMRRFSTLTGKFPIKSIYTPYRASQPCFRRCYAYSSSAAGEFGCFFLFLQVFNRLFPKTAVCTSFQQSSGTSRQEVPEDRVLLPLYFPGISSIPSKWGHPARFCFKWELTLHNAFARLTEPPSPVSGDVTLTAPPP